MRRTATGAPLYHDAVDPARHAGRRRSARRAQAGDVSRNLRPTVSPSLTCPTILLDHLAAMRPGPVWLGIWSGNVRAQAIYAACGFVPVGTYRFPVGSWFDDELIYRRG
jgi:hypothetical protein